MSGLLHNIENKLGGMMGGNSNNANANANNANNANNTASNQQATNTNVASTDRYEPTIQQGEGYVKQHYSNNVNVMRGEQLVETADNYRLGRNNMGGMQGGVGGTISSDPNVSRQNPQAGNVPQQGGIAGSDFNKQGGTDTSFDKERSTYGTDGGMGPASGMLMQQGNMANQNM